MVNKTWGNAPIKDGFLWGKFHDPNGMWVVTTDHPMDLIHHVLHKDRPAPAPPSHCRGGSVKPPPPRRRGESGGAVQTVAPVIITLGLMEVKYIELVHEGIRTTNSCKVI